MWQQGTSKLLLTRQSDRLLQFRHHVTYLEIRVSRRPAACADSRTDAVIDNVCKLGLQGTEQSTPRSGRNFWTVNDSIENARSGRVVAESE